MFYLTGKKNVLKTILLLSRTSSSKIENIQDLKASYLAFIGRNFGNEILGKLPNSLFCFDRERIDIYIDKFVVDIELTDIKSTLLKNTPVQSMENALVRVSKASEFLREKNSDLYEIFNLVIHTVFYTRSLNSGGGSVSDAPGVIWCSNRKNWTNNDLSEFLVHELTHNLVFLDELAFKHYTNFRDIAKEENYARSTILNRNRPLDKVFHSLLVAYEVLRFRLDAGELEMPIVHPPTSVIINNCFDTIDSINNLLNRREDLVTDRFRDLLKNVAQEVNILYDRSKDLVS